MKILDVKLETIRLNVTAVSDEGGQGFGVYGYLQADGRLFLPSRDSTTVRVQLTPDEQTEVRALFEKISKRLKEES